MKVRIAVVESAWTKYFELAPVAEEEEDEEGDEEAEAEVIRQRRRSRRLSSCNCIEIRYISGCLRVISDWP